MKRFVKILVVVLLLGSLIVQYDDGSLKFSAAYAQSNGILTISWVPPDQYTDGFPLLEQELDFYTFNCNGVEIKQIDSVIGTYSDSVDISDLPSDDYTCHLTVTSLLGIQSGSSNSINFTIGARVPGAPAVTAS